jgi:hypothetical protein
MSAPEPTEEDMCGGNAHDITGWVNPDTGWRECMCQLFTEPVEGEPHDEYTALTADLIDQYIAALSKMITGHSSYVNIQTAKLRVSLAPVLARKSPQYLCSLTASLSETSTLDVLDYYNRDIEKRADIAVTVGVHLDSYWRSALDTVIGFFGQDTSTSPETHAPPARAFLPDHLISSGRSVINGSNVGIARTLARLCDLAGEYQHPDRRLTGYLPEEALMTVCPLLEHREDLIPAAATIFRSQGFSKASTARIVEMVRSGEEPVQQGLVEGLL